MLVQGSGSSKQWEKIGAWRSWDGDNHGLDIQVIVVCNDNHVYSADQMVQY